MWDACAPIMRIPSAFSIRSTSSSSPMAWAAKPTVKSPVPGGRDHRQITASEDKEDSDVTLTGAPSDHWAAKTKRLQSAVHLANLKIYQSAQKHPEQRGMGATLTAAWFDNGRNSASPTSATAAPICCAAARFSNSPTIIPSSPNRFAAASLRPGSGSQRHAECSAPRPGCPLRS